VFLLFAGERFVPPEDRFGTASDPDQAEKKLSRKLNLLTVKKRLNCVAIGAEVVLFQIVT